VHVRRDHDDRSAHARRLHGGGDGPGSASVDDHVGFVTLGLRRILRARYLRKSEQHDEECQTVFCASADAHTAYLSKMMSHPADCTF
jgi:hypothetical protein